MTARAWDEDMALERIQALQSLPGALLPILNALQDEFGYIDDAAVPLVAEALNLSRAEVVGVAYFYHDYRHAPAGSHVLKVCRAEACQAMGAEALVEYLQTRLGVPMGETTIDGSITLENVYCLGNCALSPAVMLDGDLYGRVSSDAADRLVHDARRNGA
ncbi:MAG TPA: formate dehydrogenase subunit gamma [Dehalococcoidia bacterium]|jgi:formate dehydrogenase subunit gamma